MLKQILFIASTSVGLITQTLSAEPSINYAEVPDNPQYQHVIKLPHSRPDTTITYGSDPLQFAQLWLPENRLDPAPVVILIHGGCWLNAYGIDHTLAMSTALAQAGFAVWSLEYRRTGDAGGGWPGSFDDIKLGIDHLKTLDDHPLDLQRKALIGHSAGGHLALLAGSETRDLMTVIGLAAITDIEDYSRGDNSCQTATPEFMGGNVDQQQQRYRNANPIHRELHVSTHLLHGTEDSIVPLSQADVAGAQQHQIVGAGHFDWIHPGTKAFSLLLEVLHRELGRQDSAD